MISELFFPGKLMPPPDQEKSPAIGRLRSVTESVPGPGDDNLRRG